MQTLDASFTRQSLRNHQPQPQTTPQKEGWSFPWVEVSEPWQLNSGKGKAKSPFRNFMNPVYFIIPEKTSPWQGKSFLLFS
jgi:hypothetical protein